MKNKTIHLSCFLCFKGEEPLKDSALEQINNIECNDNKSYAKEDKAYIATDKVIDDRFFCNYTKYGGENPYSDITINKNTKDIEGNPRKKEQIELKNELFIIFDMQKGYLYLSNSKQLNFANQYIKEKLNSNLFNIRREYINKKDFIAQIKSIEEIEFTGTRNLFETNSDEYKALETLLLDSPTNFKIQCKYKNKSLSDKIESWFNKADDKFYDGLIIKSRDKKNLPIIFNKDAITKKIKITLKQDENGKIDEGDFFKNSISEIKKLYD